MIPRKHCLPDNRTDAHMNLQRLWSMPGDGTSSLQVRLEMGKQTQAPTPNQETICSQYPLAKFAIVESHRIY